MNRLFWPAVLLILYLVLSGCAIVTVPLSGSRTGLEEQVVEGTRGPKILLVSINGTISDQPETALLGPDSPSVVARVREELRTAEENNEISGLILTINSPGGSATASDILYHEVIAFRKRTGVPVIAVLMDVAASGGYYTALASDRIIAHPTTVTGSIGVIGMTLNLKGLLDKVGVESKVSKSGQMKDIFSPYRPDTPEEERIIQSIVSDLHMKFLSVVEEGRKGKLTRAEIEKLADGRPYTASQALQAGLIDAVGYMDDAVADMNRALGVKESRLVTYLPEGGYMGSFYGALPARPVPSSVSLFNLSADTLADLSRVRFMYLWNP